MSYHCKCRKCGEEFATDKPMKDHWFLVCPNPDCRAGEKDIEISEYSFVHHQHLFKV